MEKLKKHIHDDGNGLDYVLVGDYYIPDLQLPEESRPIGIWGRMHKAYLELYHPARYADLILSGQLWTYLADLNEQAQNRLDCIIAQMKEAEGITEELKSQDDSASSTIILLCRRSQPENSFGLVSFFFTACFRCKASFLKDSKAANISSRRSTGKPGVFFALLILFRQFWHSFL